METTQGTPTPAQEPTPTPTPAPAPAPTPAPAQKPAPTPVASDPVSHFDGRTIQLIGWRLLGLLLSAITLGIGTPWAMCMIYRWEAKHTIVDGKRLCFDGKGIQLLGKFLLWGLLILITVGIYAIFLPVRFYKWKASHTHFSTDAPAGTLKQSSGSGWVVAVAILAVLLVVSLVGGAAMMYQGRQDNKPSYDPLLDNSFPNQIIIHYGDSTMPQYEVIVQGEVWYVNNPTEGLNVRKGPDVGYEKIRNMPHGTQVNVLSWENGWAFIGDGWCAGNFLSQDPPADASQGGTPPQTNTGTVSNDPRASLTSTPPANNGVVGNWMFFTSYSGPGDNMVEVVTFQFFADGTFAALSRSSCLGEDNNGNPHWYTDDETRHSDIVSRAAWCGTYTYDGNALALHYLYERQLGSTRWYGVDQQIVLYTTVEELGIYLENPELIRYYPFEVTLDQTVGATQRLRLLPADADLYYDPNDLLLSYLGS